MVAASAVAWTAMVFQLIIRWYWQRNLKSVSGFDACVLSISLISALSYTYMACTMTYVVSIIGAKLEIGRLAEWISCTVLHCIVLEVPRMKTTMDIPWVAFSLWISLAMAIFAMLVQNLILAWIGIALCVVFWLAFPVWMVSLHFRAPMDLLTASAMYEPSQGLLIPLLCFGTWCLYTIFFFFDCFMHIPPSILTALYTIVDIISKQACTLLHWRCGFQESNVREFERRNQALNRTMVAYWKQFIEYVCHEIRNPVHAAHMSVEIARTANPDCQALRMATMSLTTATDVLDNALYLHNDSSSDTLRCYELTEFNIHDVVQKTVCEFQAHEQFMPKLNFEAVGGRWLGYADEAAFRIVSRNMILHTMMVNEPDSAVDVRLSHVLPRGHPEQELSTVTLEVWDQSRYDATRILQALSSTSSPALDSDMPGSGIALSVARLVTETRLTGCLTASQRPNGGVTYCLKVKMRLAQRGLPRSPSYGNIGVQQSLPTHILAKFNVLVVDDVLVNRKLLMRMLEDIGVQNVRSASCGAQAIEMITNSDTEPFNLVILDRIMPGMRGDEVAQQLRTTHAMTELQIFGCTGCAQQKDQQEFLKSGLDTLFTKPVMKPVLVNRLWGAAMILWPKEVHFEPESSSSSGSPFGSNSRLHLDLHV